MSVIEWREDVEGKDQEISYAYIDNALAGMVRNWSNVWLCKPGEECTAIVVHGPQSYHATIQEAKKAIESHFSEVKP